MEILPVYPDRVSPSDVKNLYGNSITDIGLARARKAFNRMLTPSSKDIERNFSRQGALVGAGIATALGLIFTEVIPHGEISTLIYSFNHPVHRSLADLAVGAASEAVLVLSFAAGGLVVGGFRDLRESMTNFRTHKTDKIA